MLTKLSFMYKSNASVMPISNVLPENSFARILFFIHRMFPSRFPASMGQYPRMVYPGMAGIPQAPLPEQPVTPPSYVVINQDYVVSPFQQQPQQLVGNTLQPPQHNFVYASQTTPTQTLTTPVTIPQSPFPSQIHQHLWDPVLLQIPLNHHQRL